MQQIINFIIRYKNFLFYILLFTISFAFTIQSHSYHNSRFFNSANWISGTIHQTSSTISAYFSLKEVNNSLVEENKRLRKLIINQKLNDSVQIDTASISYTIVPAEIIKNSYANPKNYLTLSKGQKQNIQQDMGVITSDGILGIVENTSSNFSTVQSILNTKSNINAKIKNTNYNGSLIWDTKAYSIVQLIDIPRLVPLQVGDTIVTGGMSSIFPENIPIGIIRNFELNEDKSSYILNISLFNNMANIRNVYVINNLNRPEIKQLEAKTSNDK